jgi:hypothetical protein
LARRSQHHASGAIAIPRTNGFACGDAREIKPIEAPHASTY